MASSDGRVQESTEKQEYRQYQVVLLAAKAQIFIHPCHLGVADIASVEIREGVEQCQHGQQSPVNLAQDFCRVLIIVLGEVVLIQAAVVLGKVEAAFEVFDGRLGVHGESSKPAMQDVGRLLNG